MPYPPNESGSNRPPRAPMNDPPLDFHSLMNTPDEVVLSSSNAFNAPKSSLPEATDFESLKDSVDRPRERLVFRTLTDYLIEFFTPVMVVCMVYAFVFFLLDVRYIFTEVHDSNLRFVAIFFVLGVVSLNRLIARDGAEDSILYIVLFALMVGLYVYMSTSTYDVGAVTRNFMNSSPGLAAGFNMVLVALLWWAVNRLTHECCVDENRTAGDVGLLTGTARRFHQALGSGEKKPTPKKEKGSIFSSTRSSPFLSTAVIEAYDPTEATLKSGPPKPKHQVSPVERLSKRHPGISVFYFSAVAMVVFAVGLRYTLHGGRQMVMNGHFYVGVYTVSALALLMLSSLGGIRAYFRRRNIQIPRMIGAFWISLGSLMIAVVCIGAVRLPKPSLPPIAYVDSHQTDFWTKGSAFRLENMVPTPVEMLEQARFMERVGDIVLVALGLFLGYALLRALGAVALAAVRRKAYLPQFVVRFFSWIDRVLMRFLRFPKLPQRNPRIRIARNVAQCVAFENPLRSGAASTENIIEISYGALCALAHDMGVPRNAGQTPLEFIEAFPKPLASLKEVALELTNLYMISAYSEIPLDERVHDRVRKFWVHYEKVRTRVVK